MAAQFDLDHIFRYHQPSLPELEHYQALRDAARVFAEAVVKHTPVCADQNAAVRHIREAVMTANAAVALKGRLAPERV